MEPTRRNAYRRLLYLGMLRLRGLTGTARQRGAWWNPVWWFRLRRRTIQAHAHADLLHNLAAFAAQDFDGFDEGWFWREVDREESRHPDGGFDSHLDGNLLYV